MFTYLHKVYLEREILLSLIINDLKTRYLGSYLGILWAFINPLVTVVVLWMVFNFGFKSPPVNNFPYLLWLLTGMIPWFFISESILSSSNSIIEKSFLVKKIVFDVSLLPIVKIGASLFLHLFFILILFLIFMLYGYSPSILWIQVLYYSFATVVLTFAISLITSSIVVFIKDFSQVVSIAVQFLFWLTPIFWSAQNFPEKYRFILFLNPFYYIINGYRKTLINNEIIFMDYQQTIYFWCLTIILIVVSMRIFNKLRPHFADVI